MWVSMSPPIKYSCKRGRNEPQAALAQVVEWIEVGGQHFPQSLSRRRLMGRLVCSVRPNAVSLAVVQRVQARLFSTVWLQLA
jgi:hypothetical protein